MRARNAGSADSSARASRAAMAQTSSIARGRPSKRMERESVMARRRGASDERSGLIPEGKEIEPFVRGARQQALEAAGELGGVGSAGAQAVGARQHDAVGELVEHHLVHVA